MSHFGFSSYCLAKCCGKVFGVFRKGLLIENKEERFNQKVSNVEAWELTTSDHVHDNLRKNHKYCFYSNEP